MSTTRAALMVCITALISVALITLNQYHENRYQIIPVDNGIYIFDHKTSVTNYCDTQQCVMVGQGFISPKSVTITKTMLVPSVSTTPAPAPTQEASAVEQEPAATPSYARSEEVVTHASASERRDPASDRVPLVQQSQQQPAATHDGGVVAYAPESVMPGGNQTPSIAQDSQVYQEPTPHTSSFDDAQEGYIPQDYAPAGYVQQDYE